MRQRNLWCLLFLSVLVCVQMSRADDALHSDNIVVILDASGSMKDRFSSDRTLTKMDAAKAALREVLTKVPADTHIGLLVFSGANVRNDWVYPLGPVDMPRLMAAIDRPRPSGGTPLGKYIRLGANRLLEQREKQYNYGSYRLLVVTDGEASDARKVRQYTPEVLKRQLRIDVIGVDMKTDHMLATMVDSYRRADNPGELVAAVSQILAETTDDAGTDISSQEVFEDIAPLTPEIALDLIQRLTTPPSNVAIAMHANETPPSQQVAPATPVQQPRKPRRNPIGNFPWLPVLAIAVIAFFVLRRRR